jgi:hypothetical protein
VWQGAEPVQPAKDLGHMGRYALDGLGPWCKGLERDSCFYRTSRRGYTLHEYGSGSIGRNEELNHSYTI